MVELKGDRHADSEDIRLLFGIAAECDLQAFRVPQILRPVRSWLWGVCVCVCSM